MREQDNSFIKGAMILTAAGIFVRILGAVYRIPLYSILGDVGLGYFQMAYPIYASLLAISTAGIPVAISKMVAERMAKDNVKGAYQVLRIALTLMLITGLVFSLALYFGAEYWANLMKQPPAMYSLKAISPGIFLVVVMAAFRGFFQGNQTMIPTAVSQVLEQVIRVITIFYLSSILLPHGVEFAAAGATFGVVTGSLAAISSLLIFYVFYKKDKKDFVLESDIIQQSNREVLRQMVVLALPITIASLVLPLIQMVDLVIVPRRLEVAGFAQEEAAALYGNLSGAAMPLVNVPTLFTLALAQSLIPAISTANALMNKELIRSRAKFAIKITLLIGLPSTIGMFVLAEDISFMLYNNVAVAVPLQIACLAIVFLTLHQTTSAILQGLGKTVVPVSNLFIGVVFKMVINYSLTAMPAVNIRGPALGTVISYFISSVLNLYILLKVIELPFSIKDFLLKPLFTAGGMGVFVYFANPLINSVIYTNFITNERIAVSISVLLSISLGMLVYGLLLLISGSVTKDELLSIPKIGDKLVCFLNKIGIYR